MPRPHDSAPQPVLRPGHGCFVYDQVMGRTLNSVDSAPELARKPIPATAVLSAAVAAFLVWLIYFKGRVQAPEWVSALPAANALFNSLSAICLVCGYINIRRRRR